MSSISQNKEWFKMELYFPLFLDGATGTQLQKRGYANGQCAEEWVLEHPETIQEIQQEYIEAGSQVVYASTFGANRVKLEENGIFNQVADMNHRLVALSKEKAQGKALVAGDIAPTGKFLAPMGDLSFEELVDIYTEQAKALEEAGVDLFVIETMMTVPEARAAVLAVKSVSDKPVFVTFTCDESGKTLMGSDVTAVLLIMQGMGVDAFGLNCSVGPEDMLVQLRRLSKVAEVPLIAKPNAGMPEMVDGKAVYNCPPEEFARLVPQFAAAGVAVYGGCCGTEAEHIAALTHTVPQQTIRRPKPEHPELLPLATEKLPALLPANVQIGKVLPCDENLGEALEEELDSNDALLSIRIEREEELDNLADNQFAFSKPLCLLCDREELLEQALRLYQGRALYQGSLPEPVLQRLSKKYGLVY
jgi:5-methyltetrahydrofolate--homocysteine methyltransferase